MEKIATTPEEKIEMVTEVLAEMIGDNFYLYNDKILQFAKTIFISTVESSIYKLGEVDGLSLGTRQAMKTEFIEKLDGLLKTYCDK